MLEIEQIMPSAISHKRNLLLVGSAGSGKTTFLKSKALDLISQGQRVLVVSGNRGDEWCGLPGNYQHYSHEDVLAGILDRTKQPLALIKCDTEMIGEIFITLRKTLQKSTFDVVILDNVAILSEPVLGSVKDLLAFSFNHTCNVIMGVQYNSLVAENIQDMKLYFNNIVLLGKVFPGLLNLYNNDLRIPEKFRGFELDARPGQGLYGDGADWKAFSVTAHG